ncbi:MAG: protein kinase, partial [Planctomycetes bacterium]|nr:protein kinase [Planctomycetota bacterium]
MSAPRFCPECGTPIPAGSPAGLCPKCLLKAGLESQPAVDPSPAQVPSPPPPPSGFVPPTPEQLAGRLPQFEVLELLGQGGMGAVYKARQKGLDRLVAVKILPPEVGRDPAFAERFTREARALARLNHPKIVAVHDFGQADGLYYFVMEYVDGVNLRQMLRSRNLTPKEALAIVPQVCEALQFAHDEGIVHRDIKPENVLVDKRGRVKIADFGLAKLLGQETTDPNLTATQQVMGTPRYMAPEQMEGARGVDHRADIYSLGVVFYELLTGELPVGRFAPPSQKVQIDVRLDEVVLRALEKEPEKRYQHASEVKSSVETIAATPPPPGPGMAADEQLEQAVLKQLPKGRLVAVKEYRDKTGVSIREAMTA